MAWVVAAVLIFVVLGLAVLSPYFTESHKMHERLRRLSPRKARRVARRGPSYSPLDGDDVTSGTPTGDPGMGAAVGAAAAMGGFAGGHGHSAGGDGGGHCN